MFAANLKSILPDLLGFARMLCGDKERAKDIVQDACLKAWQFRDSYDPEKGAFKAWMFTITRNAFLQDERRRKRVTYLPGHELEDQVVHDCKKLVRAACSQAIGGIFALPKPQRDALILVVVGHSYEEAARICECSIGTIKSRVNRARSKLLGIQNVDSPTLNHERDDHVLGDLNTIMEYAEILIERAA